MPIPRTAAVLVATALLAGCATTSRPGPIDVTRFHLGSPIAGDSIQVEPLNAFAGVSPEDQVYVSAVSSELTGLGFKPGDGTTLYVASVAYRHESRGTMRKPAPLTIGLGGGSYSGGRRGGVGIGGGASVGIGGGTVQIIATELTVQIKRRGEGSVVWEGRAITEGVSGSAYMQSAAVAAHLSKALFKGFPGESGITITVK